MAEETLKKTREPGIYKRTRGKKVTYRVYYRVKGKGQRTLTAHNWEEAKALKAKYAEPRAAAVLESQRNDTTTLSDYFPMWLAGKHKITESTHRRYLDVFRLYIEPTTLGDMRLRRIDREDVKAWVEVMADKGLNPPTIDKAARTLRACLNEAVNDGKLDVNPATRIETPDMDDHEAFFLTPGQVEAIAMDVPDRERGLVYALAYTGMRVGEASALRVRHVDFLRKQINVLESSAEVAGHKLEPGKTKGKRKRSIPLFPDLEQELTRHLDAYGVRDAAGNLDPDAFVFTGDRGSAVRQNNFRARVFQPAAIRVGITRPARDGKVRPPRVHDLRHTFASIAHDAGYSLHELKVMLGHSTIALTSDLYAHLYEDRMASKAEELGRIMREARDGGQVVSLSR